MTDATWGTRRTSFGSQADAYAYGRPSYPVEAVAWVLPAGAQRVLDLAAGTGRLSEVLLDTGVAVVAVEPSPEMRAHIPAGAEALGGTAESIPLEDASVDSVMVGQAFHWFDVPRSMAEIRRVLRLGGRLGLFWNMLDDSDPWVDELARILDAEERASFLRSDQDAPYSDVEGMSPLERHLFRHTATYDEDRLVAFVHSRSQTILLPDDERQALIDKVRDILPAGEFSVPLVCEAWRAERNG